MKQNQQQKLMQNIQMETIKHRWVVSSSRGTFCEADDEYSTQFTFEDKPDFFIPTLS